MARSRIARFLLLAMLLLPLVLMMIRPVARDEAHAGDTTQAGDTVDQAHEGYGVIDVEGRHPAEDGSIHYVVRVTWSEDGHPAEGSTVTATVLDPFGNAQPPVTLDPVDLDGRYAGLVTFPYQGMWTVRFTSSLPAGSIDAIEQFPISVPVTLPDITVIDFTPEP